MAYKHHDTILLVLGTVLIVLVAIADHFLPHPFVVGFGHVGVVLLALLGRRAMPALALATLGTIAAVSTFFLKPAVGHDAAAVMNLGFVIAGIWIVAVLVYALRQLRTRPPGDIWQPGQEESFYRALFNRTFQFVAALDVDGNVIEANQTLRDYAGITANEIESMAIWMLPIFQDDPEVQDRLKEKVARAANGEFSRDEFVVSGIGEQTTVIDLSLKPIPLNDGSIGQIIMEARDVTEARTQQEMLVQAQKMEAVGELTAGVAHDFNNLLTVIAGNLELLEKRFKGDRRFLDRLRRASQAAFRGQSLTQQLLAFSRRQTLSPRAIDINTSLKAMSQIYEALGENISVTFDLASDLPHCEVDPSALEVALLNIAINARDAMPDGGTLSFATKSVVLDRDYEGEVADLPPGRYVCLTVSDTGEGMGKDVVGQAFDPFFTTKPEGQGTGLGLSMVYGFVKQSQGDVKIYSEVGKGTSIRIYLPTTDQPLTDVRNERNGDGPEPVGDEVSVLFVEDDETVRETILDVLKDTAYDLDVAENGDQAIELINRGNRYDLLLTDVVMEGEAGGSDVARAARAAMPGVAVVFCSGFPRRNLQGEDAAVEGSLFLPKPFRNQELLEIMEKALARARRLPSRNEP
ncbi:MAG: ATP-binding protein [Alphaproteobacteria bacterium]|nr:ATP-binding protein [Alphaproteobacteria bacterium]